MPNKTKANGALYEELGRDKQPSLAGLKYGSISDAARVMGGVEQIRDVFVGFQQYLYVQD